MSQSFVLQQSQLKVQSSMSCTDTLVQAREVYQCWFEEQVVVARAAGSTIVATIHAARGDP